MSSLFMYVTQDEFELPIDFDESASRLAKRLGVRRNNIISCASKVTTGKQKRSKYIKVEIEDEDEDIITG